MEYSIKHFGRLNETDLDLIQITNDDVTVSFTNLGARINQWKIGSDNIILGFDNPEQAAIGKGYYYGASIGRIAGRITGGKFSINETTYQLPLNEGTNHLHGGPNGFDLKRWDYDIQQTEDAIQISFSLLVKDGENHFPGNLDVQVIHSYSVNNEWSVTFKAKSDKDTLFNPTNHVYFNLNGSVTKPILNHQLTIEADRYVPVKADGTPVGHLEKVEGTAFDVRDGKLIGEQFKLEDAQVTLKDGFDHPFVFEDNASDTPVILSVPELNRRIEVSTDRDAVVVYTHSVVDPQMQIWGEDLRQYAGVTLETQTIPDAVNHEGFGDDVLRRDEAFEGTTVYRLVY